MFCQKCGKEIHDEAVICVHCGSSVVGNSNISSLSAQTENMIAIKKFASKVHTADILGKITTVFIFGVAIIPGIINGIYISSFCEPKITTANKKELEELEAARNILKTAKFNTLLGSIANLVLWGLLVLLYLIL